MSTKRKADDINEGDATANAAAASADTSAAKSNGNADDGNNDISNNKTSSEQPIVKNHAAMMQACAAGDLASVRALLLEASAAEDSSNCSSGKNEEGTTNETTTTATTNNSSSNLNQRHLLSAQQDPNSGLSPLMMASRHGQLEICKALLEAGAPWNAVDRYAKCAGDYATENSHWDVVNMLVEAGTQAELILGASIRLAKQLEESSKNNNNKDNGDQQKDATKDTTTQHLEHDQSGKSSESSSAIPVSHEPCTKPDYLNHANVRYNAANTLLLDDDNDAVMMEWERPLMNAHANILTHDGTNKKRVLNIGFGLGIIDTALQSYEPSLHVIIEAHPTVYDKMVKDGWTTKENVRVMFGRWQDELPKLIEEGVEFDGIFYDTYGEHFTDLEDFHELMAKVLQKPDGIYSFFNGLAPDNLFFHGVACNCVKIQLSHLGLDSEFAQCEIQVKEEEWKGVRRKYWHGRDTYYLPIVTWKKD